MVRDVVVYCMTVNCLLNAYCMVSKRLASTQNRVTSSKRQRRNAENKIACYALVVCCCYCCGWCYGAAGKTRFLWHLQTGNIATRPHNVCIRHTFRCCIFPRCYKDNWGTRYWKGSRESNVIQGVTMLWLLERQQLLSLQRLKLFHIADTRHTQHAHMYT